MRSDGVGLGGRGSGGWESEGMGSVGRSVGVGMGGRTIRTYKVITNTHATINVK